jgi:dipeptidase E
LTWVGAGPLSAEPRKILAMGGGGFTMGEHSPALDRLVLELTERSLPRVCFLPTASGDPREQVRAFHERFGSWPCEPSVLSLFHLGRERIDPAAHLLSQDAIYVGGGSMRNMLAIWREHGIDETMRSAWERGIVLAGLSAGAMCWFEGGISMSGGRPEPVRGIGLLPGSLSVHLDGEPERIDAYRRAVAGAALPGGLAADDGAALLYRGRRLAQCVASRAGARVLAIHPHRLGLSERALTLALLPGSDGGGGDPGLACDQDAIAEWRELRAGRHRWD